MSFMAEREVAAWLGDVAGELDVDFYKVDVHSGRPVSDRIEQDFGIRHESPQVLWIGEGGEVRWHGSHRAISQETLAGLYADRPGG
jgi:bacillithiol system protein YtxJ